MLKNIHNNDYDYETFKHQCKRQHHSATGSINPNVSQTSNRQHVKYLTVTLLFVVFKANYFKIT